MSLFLSRRVATRIALAIAAPAILAAQQPAPGDSAVVAILALVRTHAVARAGAEAAVAAAQAAVSTAALPAPLTIGVGAEGVPSGLRLDRAGQVLATAEWTLWRGPAARSLQQAAEARPAVLEAWREMLLTVAESRARAALAVLAGATLRRDRLDAEAALLADAERALNGRVTTGEARYLDVLRLRTARLQVAAERAAESATASKARTAVVMGIAAGAPRDSAARLLATWQPAAALATLVGMAARTDTREAGALIAAIHAANRAAITARRRSIAPAVDATLGVERFGAPDEGWSLGPALGMRVRVPLPGSAVDRRIARAAEADLAAVEAEITLRAAKASAAHEAGIAVLDAARERLDLLSSALLDGAPAERAAAVAAFTAGRLTLIELLDFERALSRITLERLDAQVDAAVASADIALAGLEPYLTLDLLLGGVP